MGLLLKKKSQRRKLRMKIELKVNSNSIFDYNMISLGDTADWKSALAVTVASRVDTAIIVIQVVRVSI